MEHIINIIGSLQIGEKLRIPVASEKEAQSKRSSVCYAYRVSLKSKGLKPRCSWKKDENILEVSLVDI